MFVSIDLLERNEMIFSKAQKFSKYLVDSYKSSMTFFMVDKSRKDRPKTFIHWKDCLFSKLCVFNNLLGLKNAVTISKVLSK